MNKPEFVGQRTKSPYKAKYGNYIGGQWVDALDGETFENTSPVTGQVICEVARSKAADVERALDAAHKAAPGWGQTSVAQRAVMLNKIADRMEEHLDEIALAETWDNGKPIRETTAISPVPSAPRRAAFPNLTMTRWLIISTSPSASWGRSFRGTSLS